MPPKSITVRQNTHSGLRCGQAPCRQPCRPGLRHSHNEIPSLQLFQIVPHLPPDDKKKGLSSPTSLLLNPISPQPPPRQIEPGAPLPSSCSWQPQGVTGRTARVPGDVSPPADPPRQNEPEPRSSQPPFGQNGRTVIGGQSPDPMKMGNLGATGRLRPVLRNRFSEEPEPRVPGDVSPQPIRPDKTNLSPAPPQPDFPSPPVPTKRT